jgi:hypothetical protein
MKDVIQRIRKLMESIEPNVMMLEVHPIHSSANDGLSDALETKAANSSDELRAN